MRYKKETGSFSWIIFDETAIQKSGRFLRRKIARVVFNELHPEQNPTIEPISAQDEELEEIGPIVEKIRRKFVKSSRKMLIVCEGQTERIYFTEMVQTLGLQAKVDVIKSPSSSPATALAHIGRELVWNIHCGRDNYSEAWLVFDRDSHPNFEACYAGESSLPQVHMVWTNPCFEFWLLLHFEAFEDNLPLDQKISKGISKKEKPLAPNLVELETTEVFELTTSADVCFNKLKTFHAAYKKNAEGYLDEYGARTKLAYQRARQLGAPKDGHGSTIPDLLDRFAFLLRKSVNEMFSAICSNKQKPSSQVSEATEFKILYEQIGHTVSCTKAPVMEQSPRALRKFAARLERMQAATVKRLAELEAAKNIA